MQIGKHLFACMPEVDPKLMRKICTRKNRSRSGACSKYFYIFYLENNRIRKYRSLKELKACEAMIKNVPAISQINNC